MNDETKINLAIAGASSFADFLAGLKTLLVIEYDQDLAARLGLTIDALSHLRAQDRQPSARNFESIIENLKIARQTKEYYQLLDLVHKARLGNDKRMQQNES